MEFIEDFDQQRDFNDLVLTFIEEEEEEYFLDLSNFIEKQNFMMNKKLLHEFIEILINIINNCHRYPDFFGKIIKIVQLLTKDMQQHYSNEEIFKFFSFNKRILLSLIENKVILLDKRIIYILTNSKDMFGCLYRRYFPKEMEPFLTIYVKNALKFELKNRGFNSIGKDFEEKRLKGENESYICTLIREDSAEEFISYANRSNISLSMKIKPTILETNMLLNKDSTLIEYAAFFGSIEIFQYLKYNNVPLTPSLWIYAIHSNNANLIHILEENDVSPPKDSYKACLKEAIKCHHNNAASYFLDKMTDSNNNYNLSIAIYCFKFKNFSFLPQDIDAQSVLYAACKCNEIDIVKKILETQQININYKYCKKIQKKFILK